MAAQFLTMGKVLPTGSMDFMHQAFRLDLDETAAIFRDAGLSEIIAETVEEAVSLPRIADFLPGHVASLPCSGAFEALSSTGRQLLYSDISKKLTTYIQQDEGLLVPFAVHMVSGIR